MRTALFEMRDISIHAPHEGERRIELIISHNQTDFNPRSPRGGATNGAYDAIARDKFQSTLPTRGSDGVCMFDCTPALGISIHAPHEGERRCVHV